MFQQRGALRLELQPISGTSIADLDRRRLVDYFERVRGQEVPAASPFNTWRQEVEAWAKSQDEKRWRALAEDREREWRAAQEADWESLLVNTDLLHEDMPHSATVAGLMLFGRDPSRILPHAKIDAAAYFGTEKDYKRRKGSPYGGRFRLFKGATAPRSNPASWSRRWRSSGGTSTRFGLKTAFAAGSGGTIRRMRCARPSSTPSSTATTRFRHRHRNQHLCGPLGSHQPRPSAERHHAGADARWLPKRPQRTAEGRDAGLRLFGAHGDGCAAQNRARHEGAQRYGARLG